MRRKRLGAVITATAATAAMLLFLGPAASDSAPRVGGSGSAWAIRDLDTSTSLGSRATDINDRGQIVGLRDTKLPGEGASVHAFLWSAGRIRDLGTLPLGGRLDMPNMSEARAINNRGQVIGTSEVSQNMPQPRGFVWFRGTMRPLRCGKVPPARCGDSSVPVAINERGQIAGHVGNLPEDVRRPLRAALWQNATMRSLGTLAGRTASTAVAVDERGRVAGTGYVIRGDYYHLRLRAFLWQNGRLRDLGALPGDGESEAVGMNDRGEVIGLSYANRTESGGGTIRGFLWKNGAMRDLGALRPFLINNRGQVVGVGASGPALWIDGRITALPRFEPVALNQFGQIAGSRETDGKTHAVLWQNGTLTDLGTLAGGRSSGASALSERGEVAGWSSTRSGRRHAVLWSRR